MKKNILSLALILAGYHLSFGQNVGIGTLTPDASALLELNTTTKGFLPPRMTAAQRALIPAPKAGLIIYQTDAGAGLYVYNGAAWAAAAGSGAALTGWSTTGNAGTLPATQFIGTTDNVPLKFRVNNVPSGELNFSNANMAFGIYALESNTTGGQNTAVGFNSLNKNLTGDDNTALGIASLYSNTFGSQNTALGTGTLSLNTTGTGNLAAGFYSMNQSLTGKYNVSLGHYAMYSNESGTSNVAIGKHALFFNKKISNLVAIGDSALFNNGTGNPQSAQATGNTAVGSKALYANTIGSGNTANGYQALYANKSGVENTAIGYNSLNNNVLGDDNTAVGVATLFNNTSGSDNTAIGFATMSLNTTGRQNVANGSFALYSNTTGTYNVAIGDVALKLNTSGSYNTGIGQSALFDNKTGNYNSGIGALTNMATDNLTNATAIGAHAEVACSNCLVLGSVNGENNATANVKVGIGTTAPLADLHIKQSNETYPVNGGGLRLERVNNTNHWDIATDNTSDLDFTYNAVSRGYINHTTGVYTATSDIRMKKDIKVIETVLPRVMQLQAKTYHYLDNKSDDVLSYGFMAQEVEKVFPDFVTTKGKDGLKAIAYQNFTVITVKALQEQQAQIEVLKEENKILKERLDKLQAAIENIQRK